MIIIIFIIIIIFSIIAILYSRKILKDIEKITKDCESSGIDDYDYETFSIVSRYIKWSNILLIITIIFSIISIVINLYYDKNVTTLYEGWELWGTTMLLSLLTTGSSLLLFFSASYLSKIKQDQTRLTNRAIIAASLVTFVNSFMYIANIIFFYIYLEKEKYKSNT